MPRYLVERSFPGVITLPQCDTEGGVREALIECNRQESVTWLYSLVVSEQHRSYCVCDAPSPEAVRRAARRSGLPVDRILEVRVLDPYGLGLP
jgi:hypothetical protein